MHSSLANSSGWLSNGSEPFLKDWTLLMEIFWASAAIRPILTDTNT